MFEIKELKQFSVQTFVSWKLLRNCIDVGFRLLTFFYLVSMVSISRKFTFNCHLLISLCSIDYTRAMWADIIFDWFFILEFNLCAV